MVIIIIVSCTFSLCELSVLHFEEDWILDIQWISQQYKEFKLAIMFAHNRVVIFDSLTNTRYTIRSEVNCILYPINYREGKHGGCGEIERERERERGKDGEKFKSDLT